MDSVVYPVGREVQLRTLSTFISLIATTVISYCFALRAFHVDFSPRALFSMKATKWLLLLLFIDSWAFIFLSGLLVNGVGTSLSPLACSMGIYTCILFYCASKLLTYLFLLEKVYIVWPNKGTRWSSTAYKTGFVALLGFVVVLVMMVIGRVAYIREDRQCVIGLHKAASMTTVFVDLAVNVLLTSLFLWPLWQSKFLSVNIRRVASRTLIASSCTLIISVTNLTILTVLHGTELAWICLGSCSTDVLINALVLFWLTRSRHDAEEQSTGVTAATRGKSINLTHLRPISGAVTSSFNGKTSKMADDGVDKKEKQTSSKGDLEQYAYYSEVYDGSSQYLRSGQIGSPTLASPTLSAGEKNSSSPTYPPLSPPALSYQQRHHRHSVGLYQDNVDKKTTGDVDRNSFLEIGRRNRSNSNGNGAGILERLGLRSGSSNGNVVHYAGLRSVGGVGTKKRKANSDGGENIQVRVTVNTHLEDDDDLRTDVEATTKSIKTSTSSA